MRKRFSLLASGAVVIVPLALSACGNNSPTPTPTPTPTATTSALFQDQFGSSVSTLYAASADTAEPSAVANASIPALDPTIEPKDN